MLYKTGDAERVDQSQQVLDVVVIYHCVLSVDALSLVWKLGHMCARSVNRMGALLRCGETVAEDLQKGVTSQVADGGLWLPQVRRPVAHAPTSQELELFAEPYQELPRPDVCGLPPSVEEAAPCTGEEGSRVVAPHGVPDDVGHALLEVLQVGASLLAGDVTTG